MNRKGKVIWSIFGLILVSPFAWAYWDGYAESLNKFTLSDVCKIRKGMNIEEAWALLGKPKEFHNYNFSNVYSAQYRNLEKKFFLEIYYTQDVGTVTEIFWGQGRTKTLAESGACSNIINP